MLHDETLFRVAMLAAVLAVVSGCGPKHPETIPVNGSVALDGKPVEGAAVVFTPEEGRMATGTTDASGRFQLSTFQLGDGALPGTHRVTVAKTSVDPADPEKVVFLVPKKYGNPATSGLSCDVQKEMGPVSFELASEPQPEPKPEPASSEPPQEPVPGTAAELPKTDEPTPPTPPAEQSPGP